MNVDILDSDGVIVTTGAFDDAFWRAYGPNLQSRIASTGMALSAPGSGSAERRVDSVGSFDALVQSASMSGERARRSFGYDRPHPHFGFGHRHPRFGLGDATLLPPSKSSFSITEEAKDALKMGGAGTVAFVIAKSLGVGLLGSAAAAAGGVALAAKAIAKRISA